MHESSASVYIVKDEYIRPIVSRRRSDARAQQMETAKRQVHTGFQTDGHMTSFRPSHLDTLSVI